MTALLEWQDAYSLGIPSVDLEHREMIGLINRCYQQMGEGARVEDIEQFLGEIHSGIAAHFALEEKEMRESSYPEFEAHKEDHEDLLDDIRDMMDLFIEDPESGTAMLQDRLSDWFGRHFATFDARLHDHFAG